MSLLPRLVERQHLQPAHARIDGADAVSATAGPALGGLLVSTVGAPLTVLVDALTYVYSALTLRRIELVEPAPRTGVTASGLLREVADGVRWVYRDSGLRALAIWTHAWFVGHAIVGVVLAPYVLRTLDLTAFQFGMIGAAGGVGAFLGATVTTWVGRRLGTGRTIIVCHLITALGVIALVLAGREMARAGTVAVLAVGQGLYGLAMGMSNSHEMSYRQLITPDELQARTNTTLRSQPCGDRSRRASRRDPGRRLGYPSDAGAGGRDLRTCRRRTRRELVPRRASPRVNRLTCARRCPLRTSTSCCLRRSWRRREHRASSCGRIVSPTRIE